MKFAIIGGDRRQIETAIYLKNKNHSIKTYGLPKINGIICYENIPDTIFDTNAVILPLPVTKDGITVNTPLTDDFIKLSEILESKPKYIFGGIIPKNLKEKIINANTDYYDYYDSEKLTVRNAILTAEAAISIAIKNTTRSLYGSKALVLGYGRIGKLLSKYLHSLGSEVTATSRNDETLVNIEIDGFIPLKTGDILDAVEDFDYIFNTIPAPILNSEFFALCKPNVFIEDLATNSGISLDDAKKFSINANIYGGLPGKYSPTTAAEFIANEILNKCKDIKF